MDSAYTIKWKCIYGHMQMYIHICISICACVFAHTHTHRHMVEPSQPRLSVTLFASSREILYHQIPSIFSV